MFIKMHELTQYNVVFRSVQWQKLEQVSPVMNITKENISYAGICTITWVIYDPVFIYWAALE